MMETAMRKLLLLAFLLFPFSLQAEDNKYSVPVMTVRGEAVTKLSPDQVTLPVTIREENTDIKAAKEAHDKKLTALIQLANDIGIEKANVQTSYTTINPQYDYAGSRPVLRDYLVETSINFKLNAISQLGEFINKIIGLGITEMGSISYSLHDEEKIKQETLEKALANAYDKASRLAATAKVTIDKPVDISEGEIFIDRPHPFPMMGARAHPMMAMATPVQAAPEMPSGLIEIRQSVTVTYQLK
jgi:uncharacterized protein YggE